MKGTWLIFHAPPTHTQTHAHTHTCTRTHFIRPICAPQKVKLVTAASQREAAEARLRSQVQMAELRCSALQQENEGLDGEEGLIGRDLI